MDNENVCSGGPKLIFACSGAADVGEIADKAARKLTAAIWIALSCAFNRMDLTISRICASPIWAWRKERARPLKKISVK
jgi:hypothetical protein